MSPNRRLNLQSRELHDHAHERFKWMREHEPVYRARFGRKKDIYLVTRYDDVTRLLGGDGVVKDPHNSSLGTAGERVLKLPK